MVHLYTVGFIVVLLCLNEPCVALLWLGDASYVMCTALYMMVLYDRACVGPTTKTSKEISIICLFRLILQANPFVFVLSCGIRVASKSNVDSITFLSGVLIFLCEY